MRFVPLDRVLPHEAIDQRRAERLHRRLTQDGYLANPPIVTEIEDGYLLLDGATRVAALHQLECPDVIAQVVSPEGLRVESWVHVVRQIGVGDLIDSVRGVAGISLRPTDPAQAADELVTHDGLCLLQTIEDEALVVVPHHGTSRPGALTRLSQAYIGASHVTRVPEGDVAGLRVQFSDMAALMVFPTFALSEVERVARSGERLPAGITRFIVPGRVLRLNADLAQLKSHRPVEEKNRWLQALLEEKREGGTIRYYAEPVYLLDE